MRKRLFRLRPYGKVGLMQCLCAFVVALSGLSAAAYAGDAALGDGTTPDSAAVKEIGWVGVTQSDMTAAERFFGELLELDESGRMDDMGLVIYQLPSGQIFELISEQAPDSELYRRPLLGFLVEDAEQAKKTMESRGLAFSSDLIRVPGAAWAFFNGPDGYTHEIVENPEPSSFDQSGKQLKIKGIGAAVMPAKDHRATAEFFRKFLDLAVKSVSEEPPFTLFEFRTGNFFEVSDADQSKTKNYPLIAFEVDDIEAARNIVLKRGVGASEITSAEAAQWFYLDGPDDVLYEIISIDRSKL